MEEALLGLSLLLYWLGCRGLAGQRAPEARAAGQQHHVRARCGGWLTVMPSVFGGLLALIASAHLVAGLFTGGGLDQSVLYHLAFGLAGAGFREYLFAMALAVLLLLLSLAYALFCLHAARRVAPAGRRHWGAVALLLLSPWLNTGLADAASLLRDYSATSQAAPLPAWHAVPAGLSRAREGRPPRNLVLIYAESLERSYLDAQRFPGLLPRLAELEREALSFTAIQGLEETAWTIGGMVASQCGVPLVINASGASMARTGDFLPGAVCLGDLLREQGYQLHYLGGADGTFAGKHSFYRSHGFHRVEGLAELKSGLADPDYLNPWGLFDDVTLARVKQRYDALSTAEEPFALLALTLDTHHPAGHLSAVCRERPYAGGDNPMLNAVHCADRQIAGLIEYIRQSPAAEDTLVVVMSDHLALPNTATGLLDTGARHNLFLALGADVAPARMNRPGTTLDLAPTLLRLLGFDIDRLGLGVSLLAEEPTLAESHGEQLQQVLRSFHPALRQLWHYPGVTDGLLVDTRRQRVQLGARSFRYPALMTLTEDLRIDELMQSDALPGLVAMLPDAVAVVWLDRCSALPPGDQRWPQEAVCLVVAPRADARPQVKVINQRWAQVSGERLLAWLQPAPAASPRATAGLASHIGLNARARRQVQAGEVRVNGQPLPPEQAGSAQFDQLPAAGLSVEAVADPHARFVQWRGLEGARRYQPTLQLRPDDAPVVLQPEFDVSVTVAQAEWRSAWAAIRAPDDEVTAHLAPGDSQYSVARLRRQLTPSLRVDLRATGGTLPLRPAYFARVNGRPALALDRGISFIVVDTEGVIRHARSYDTYARPADSDALARDLREQSREHFWLFVTFDEFTAAVTPALRAALAEALGDHSPFAGLPRSARFVR